MTRFRKFIALPTSDQRLLLRAALWLGLVRASLWVLPFQNLLDRLTSPGPGRESSPPALGAADRIGWAVLTASRYVPGARSCLPRALAAAVLLRRAGLPAQVRVGGAHGEDGSPEAHAWVECGGQVVIGGSELERYTLISALKGAGE